MLDVGRYRDRVAGGVIGAIGLAAATVSSGYPVGELREMGPGFFPLVLGALLMVLGVAIAVGSPSGESDPNAPEGLEHPEPVGWACIVGGVAAFIVLARPTGMLPATFACVFISAMGDRTATWRSALVLAACVSAAGVALFHYGLKIQLPPVAW